MSDLTRLIDRQRGLVARRQLSEHGVHWDDVHNRRLAGRCVVRTPRVISTFTGELTSEQRRWLGVLHAGPRSMLGGLTAAHHLGLRRWKQDPVTVLVDDELAFEPVDGIDFFRSPTCSERCAAHPRSERPCATSPGARSPVLRDVVRMCRVFSLLPPDRQRPRLDRGGRRRWTDCEWDLPTGAVLVLEVDGSFRMEVEHWGADKLRARRLTTHDRTVIGCTAYEVRHEPAAVARDVIALGVPRLDAACA